MINVNKDKLSFLASPIFLLIATFFIFGPIYLYITNAQELWFGLEVVLGSVLVSSLAVGLILLLIGVLLPERISKLFGVFLTGLGLAFYVQSYLLQGRYGLFDGKAVDWSQYSGQFVINGCVWAACLISPFIIYKFKQGAYLKGVGKAILLLVAIQLIVVLFMALSLDWRKKDPFYLSDEKILSLSNNKNIVVFVLDTFDMLDFEQLLANESSLPAHFIDFTYYANTVGIYSTTKAAVPYILTGIPYLNETSYKKYLERAYSETPFYEVMRQNEYQVGIYTASNFVDQVFIESNHDILMNGAGEAPQSAGSIDFTKELYRFNLVRFAPLALKRFMWVGVNNFDNLQSTSKSGGNSYKLAARTDLKFYSAIKKGLEISAFNDSSKPWFKFYHLHGAHQPALYDENLNWVENGEPDSHSILGKARGSLKIVEEFIRQLKKHNIYDQTMIIVMADHGHASFSPILMIKEWNADASFETSHVPVSYFDLMPSLLKYVSGEAGTFRDWLKEEEQSRIFLDYNWAHLDWKKDYMPPMTEFIVRGAAKDMKYEKTGIIYERGKKKRLEIPVYNLGSELFFTKASLSAGRGGKAAAQYFTSSLSFIESTHTWSSGPYSTMELLLDRHPQMDLSIDISLHMHLDTGQGGQEVKLSANGQEIGRKHVSSPADWQMNFVVPKSIISDRKLSLRFDYPNAAYPCFVGINDDVRLLAVAFKSLVINEGASPAEKSSRPVYKLGKALSFAGSQEPAQYFTSGLSKAENTHTWSLGQFSTMELLLNRQPQKDLSLDIMLLAHLDTGQGGQEIILSAEGREIGRARLVLPEDKHIKFVIPKEAVTDRKLSLRFDYPNAASPSSVGLNADTRVLAVAFKSIIISEQR